MQIAWVMPIETLSLISRKKTIEVAESMEAAVGYALIESGRTLMNSREFSRWGGIGNPATNPKVADKISKTKKEQFASPKKKAEILAKVHTKAANEKRRTKMLQHWASGKIREKVVSTWDAKRGFSKPEKQKHEPCRPVVRTDTNQMFPSCKDAAISVNRCPSNITRAIKRSIKCAGTYWAYA